MAFEPFRLCRLGKEQGLLARVVGVEGGHALQVDRAFGTYISPRRQGRSLPMVET